jgi:hypothetical protein
MGLSTELWTRVRVAWMDDLTITKARRRRPVMSLTSYAGTFCSTIDS